MNATPEQLYLPLPNVEPVAQEPVTVPILQPALFEPWPKLPRLYRDCTITEKIDGTNAQIYIPEDPKAPLQFGSRTRWVSIQSDNYGFARWGYDRSESIRELLGPGRHYGEWWGVGINRAYGMRERRFYLFNTQRWEGLDKSWGDKTDMAKYLGIGVVPVLYKGAFTLGAVETVIEEMRITGSRVVPFMDPEGIVVFHEAARLAFKVTLDGDGHKGTASHQMEQARELMDKHSVALAKLAGIESDGN